MTSRTYTVCSSMIITYTACICNMHTTPVNVHALMPTRVLTNWFLMNPESRKQKFTSEGQSRQFHYYSTDTHVSFILLCTTVKNQYLVYQLSSINDYGFCSLMILTRYMGGYVEGYSIIVEMSQLAEGQFCGWIQDTAVHWWVVSNSRPRLSLRQIL